MVSSIFDTRQSLGRKRYQEGLFHGAWRKRRYEAAFVSKLNDAESEACPVK